MECARDKENGRERAIRSNDDEDDDVEVAAFLTTELRRSHPGGEEKTMTNWGSGIFFSDLFTSRSGGGRGGSGGGSKKWGRSLVKYLR